MGRISRIPQAIVKLLTSGDRDCWTIEEIQHSLNSAGVAADFSSIFRASQKLEEEGVLNKVELNDGKSHFEITRRHHDHLVCQKCQTVSQIPCEFFEKSIKKTVLDMDFQVLSHTLILEGICKTCQSIEVR